MTEQFTELLLSMMKDKKTVLKTLLEDLTTCDKNKQAFQKLEALFARQDAGENVVIRPEKVVKACAKSLAHLNDVNTRLLLLLIVYASGKNFDTDISMVLMKFGKGDEALRTMFESRFGKGDGQ